MSRKPTAFLVEDTEDDVMWIQSRLKKMGFSVSAARSRREALAELVNMLHVDLLVLDARIPDKLGGVEAVEVGQKLAGELAASKRLADASRLVHTAYGVDPRVDKIALTLAAGGVSAPTATKDPDGLERAVQEALSARDVRVPVVWVIGPPSTAGVCTELIEEAGCDVMSHDTLAAARAYLDEQQDEFRAVVLDLSTPTDVRCADDPPKALALARAIQKRLFPEAPILLVYKHEKLLQYVGKWPAIAEEELEESLVMRLAGLVWGNRP